MNRKGLLFITILAAVIFNNWLLALVFNRHLLFSGGSVSEFSALDQPHAWVFRSLDIVSGILFVTLAFYLSKRNKNPTRVLLCLVWTTAVLGISNALDALLPLSCSATLNAACNEPVRFNLHQIQLPTHSYSSTVIGICYVLLPIAGWLYTKSKSLKIVSALTLLSTLVFFGCLIFAGLADNSSGTRTVGFSQDAQMLVLGAWYILWIRAAKITDANST